MSSTSSDTPASENIGFLTHASSTDIHSPSPTFGASADPTFNNTAAPTTTSNPNTISQTADVPTTTGFPNTNNSNQSNASAGSKARIAGIVSGISGALIICLVILLCIRRCSLRRSFMVGNRRYGSKKAIETPELCTDLENGNAVVPLSLPPVSSQHTWPSERSHQAGPVSCHHTNDTTGAPSNKTQHVIATSTVEPENTQTVVEPTSSVMQEVGNLRARIIEIERRQQQEVRRNSILPNIVDSGGTEDSRSAPPAYSDDGRF